MTSSEVIKFSAGGFRDFTRIAASDPTMWRDVFLANKDAVLEMLGTFNEDLAKLTRPGFRGARFRPHASAAEEAGLGHVLTNQGWSDHSLAPTAQKIAALSQQAASQAIVACYFC